MNAQARSKIQWVVFAFCFALIGWRAFTITTTNGGGRDNVYGDSFSDKNVISAVHYYHDSGFTRNCFLPVQQYDGPGDTSYTVYTHFPPVPDILAGFYGAILHTTDERLLRIFPILWAIIWFWLIFKILKAVIKDEQAAFWSGIIIVMSNYFIAWSDNLHKHALEELLKWLYVYCIFQYYEGGRQKKIYILWLCLIFIAAINVSFEPATYLAVVSVGFSLLYTRKVFSAATILPGIAAVTGFMLHMAQNAAYFGSWTVAIEDMKAAFLLRAAGVETEGMTHSEVSGNISLLHIMFDWFNRMERFYLVPGWALIILGFWGVPRLWKQDRKLFYILLILFIASISWSFAMSHHTFVHLFTNKQFGVFYAFAVGYFLVTYAESVKKSFTEKKYAWMAFHSFFVLYMVAMAASQQVYALYLKNGFAFQWMN